MRVLVKGKGRKGGANGIVYGIVLERAQTEEATRKINARISRK